MSQIIFRKTWPQMDKKYGLKYDHLIRCIVFELNVQLKIWMQGTGEVKFKILNFYCTFRG